MTTDYALLRIMFPKIAAILDEEEAARMNQFEQMRDENEDLRAQLRAATHDIHTCYANVRAHEAW